MRPDLTHGKGTGPSPALGVNRGGSLVGHLHFLEGPRPSAEVKSLVEMSPCPRVSLSDTGDPSRRCLHFRHLEHGVAVVGPELSGRGCEVSEWEQLARGARPCCG